MFLKSQNCILYSEKYQCFRQSLNQSPFSRNLMSSEVRIIKATDTLMFVQPLILKNKDIRKIKDLHACLHESLSMTVVGRDAIA